MNLAQLINAEAAREARLAAPRQFGQPLGVRTHTQDKAGDQPPSPPLVALPETQAAARRVMANSAISRAKERADALHQKRQRARAARQARIDARAKKRAAKIAAARRAKSAALKDGPRRRGKPRTSRARGAIQAVLARGPMKWAAIWPAVEAWNDSPDNRDEKQITWTSARTMLRDMVRSGEVVVCGGTAQRLKYGLAKGAA